MGDNVVFSVSMLVSLHALNKTSKDSTLEFVSFLSKKFFPKHLCC